MAVFGMAFFRATVVIFIIVGVQATRTIATSTPTESMTGSKGSKTSLTLTPTTNHSSTALPTTRNHSTGNTTTPGDHSTAHPTTPGTNSTTPPSKPGNHSTIPPPKPGNHSTIPPSKSGNHSEPTTQESHSSKTPSPKGHGKGAHGDSRGKWVAAGFAVFFAITTIIMTALYCRQRKIYRELEGDSSLSRLI